MGILWTETSTLVKNSTILRLPLHLAFIDLDLAFRTRTGFERRCRRVAICPIMSSQPTIPSSATSQGRRDVSDEAAAASISKSLASIIQASENPLFRRTCVELIRRWGANGQPDRQKVAPLSGSSNMNTIGKPVAEDILRRLHQLFVGK